MSVSSPPKSNRPRGSSPACWDCSPRRWSCCSCTCSSVRATRLDGLRVAAPAHHPDQQQAVQSGAIEAANLTTLSRAHYRVRLRAGPRPARPATLRQDLVAKKADYLSAMNAGKFDLKSSVVESRIRERVGRQGARCSSRSTARTSSTRCQPHHDAAATRADHGQVRRQVAGRRPARGGCVSERTNDADQTPRGPVADQPRARRIGGRPVAAARCRPAHSPSRPATERRRRRGATSPTAAGHPRDAGHGRQAATGGRAGRRAESAPDEHTASRRLPARWLPAAVLGSGRRDAARAPRRAQSWRRTGPRPAILPAPARPSRRSRCWPRPRSASRRSTPTTTASSTGWSQKDLACTTGAFTADLRQRAADTLILKLAPTLQVHPDRPDQQGRRSPRSARRRRRRS